MSKITDFEKAYELLKTYNGSNNQILYDKFMVEKKNYSLSDFEVTYILNNYDYKPYEMNKVVKISSDYGEILQKKYELDFKPEKIKISRVIGEMGESLHCYVQYRQSIAPCLMYVKRNYILAPIENTETEEKIDINFKKYDNLTKRSGRKLKEVQKTGILFFSS